MAKTSAMPPAMGAQGTTRKKSKKMRLLRNPFSDTDFFGSSAPSAFRNPFCDSFALIHTYGDARSSETDGDEDGEEDEARIMHARRQALVALDPTNRDSWKAEFKSLKEYSLKKMSLEQQRRQELELLQQKQQQQQQSRKMIETSPEPLEVLDEPPPDQSHEDDQVVPDATPPSSSLKRLQESSDSYDPYNRDSRHSLFSTPRTSKIPEADVPEISISLATPPPTTTSSSSSSTQNHSQEPSSSTAADPSLLSTTYTPSPLSSSSLDPLDASWQQNLAPEKAKAKERRTTVVYRSLLQRVSPSAPAIVRPIVLGASAVEDSDGDPLGAQQIEGEGTTITPKPFVSSSWSLNRNTFGAFSKLDQRHQNDHHQHQHQHQHDEQDKPQQPAKQKLKRGSQLFRKQRSSRHALDPWDSSDDMLIQVTDDDDGNESETPFSNGGRESFLKGRIGVSRTSVVGARADTDHGTSSAFRSTEKKGSVSVEDDWIVHPRTAAIKGTFHRVQEEVVPVPSKKDSRPSSLGPEFLTISLSSPPRQAPKQQTFEDSSSSSSLTRAQSIDSPLAPLRKGASAFLSGLRNAPLHVQGSGSHSHDAMNKDVAESTTQIRRMMNGQAHPLTDGHSPRPRPSDGPHSRSSMMTFGSRMSTNSPPRITLSSSFASFRDLISSATGLVRSSSSVCENATAATMWAPFSPAPDLSGARSTAFYGVDGGGGGSSGTTGRHSIDGVRSGTGGVSFSPGSRRKTALVMVAPTITVAQKASPSTTTTTKNDEKKDLDASSMHTISSSPNASASSSFTTLSSSFEPQAKNQDRGAVENNEKSEEVKAPESSGHHAVPSTSWAASRHTLYGQRLTSAATTTMTARPRHHSLLKVPEPAKAGSSHHHHHHHQPSRPQYSPPTSVAASAMAAAQRAWLSSPGLTRGGERELIRSTSTSSLTMTTSLDSLTGPLTGDDYIGQFERERAKARGMTLMTGSGSGSFATEAETSSSSSSFSSSTTAAPALSSTTLGTTSEASEREHQGGSKGELRKKKVIGDETHHRPSPPPPFRRCNTSPDTYNKNNNHHHSNAALRHSFLQTIRLRQDSSSGPLDMSDKLMHLPEPSRFEGMCSCRGVINIASMFLILLGLVLLILGYPIATSLNKDRVAAAEAAAGTSGATVPANAPGADVLVATAAAAGAAAAVSAPPGLDSVAVVKKRSVVLTDDMDKVTTTMATDKGARFVREGRAMNVVFSDEFHQKSKLA
ncbi:hypothetical protein EC968_000619 [Mortierella alpina]|nr:hypothetical protein EC968_000619 [Mortierella alpina]